MQAVSDGVGGDEFFSAGAILIHEILEADGVVDFGHGLLRFFPEGQENAVAIEGAFILIGSAAGHAFDGGDGALDEADDIAGGELAGVADEIISAHIAALGCHEPCLLELTQDNFKESRGDGLDLGDFGDTDGPLVIADGEFKDGAEGILAFLGDHHGDLSFFNIIGQYDRQNGGGEQGFLGGAAAKMRCWVGGFRRQQERSQDR